MPSPALSILIPARNEFFHELDLLSHTVTNVLANTSDQTEIVVILDGYDSKWPPQPLPVNSRVTVVQHDKSIGQRAACNEAARIARGKWICKLDAHCAVGPRFDELMTAQCDYLTTLIAVQYNLHAFSWKCKQCKHESYQGPKPAKCEKCGSRYTKIVVKWQPRGWKERNGVWEGRPKTTAWRFDSTLHFQYDHNREPAEGEVLTETLSCLGACWMVQRERYWELEGMDEKHGSWGAMGTELACKSWLSGGRMMVNHSTWFAHLFRTQPAFGFPYPNPGIEQARARSRAMWMKNQWPKQVYPLSWLIDRFKPLRDWHTIDNSPALAEIQAAGTIFRRVVSLPTNDARPISLSGVAKGKQVSANAMGTPSLLGGGTVAAKHVVSLLDQPQVGGITAASVVADEMIDKKGFRSEWELARQRTNQPCPHDSVQSGFRPTETNSAVAVVVGVADPDPAASNAINANARKDSSDLSCGEMGDSEILSDSHDSALRAELGSGSEPRDHRSSGPSKCLLYYTCGTHDETLEQAARNNLLKSKNGHELGCVALQRTNFGDWTVVVNREKSGGTMHYQILAGLERSTADYVFLCESDVLYHRSHFDFVPPDDKTIFYNTNVWRIRYSDGHAVRTSNLQQVSGICANRLLLLAHYKRRVELIEASGGVFDTKRMAYEPGTRGKFGDEKIANWESLYPNLDITGHGKTLTTPHFSVESFRNKKHAEGWTETDGQIDGWPLIYGRVGEWLEELAHGDTGR